MKISITNSKEEVFTNKQRANIKKQLQKHNPGVKISVKKNKYDEKKVDITTNNDKCDLTCIDDVLNNGDSNGDVLNSIKEEIQEYLDEKFDEKLDEKTNITKTNITNNDEYNFDSDESDSDESDSDESDNIINSQIQKEVSKRTKIKKTHCPVIEKNKGCTLFNAKNDEPFYGFDRDNLKIGWAIISLAGMAVLTFL